MRQKIESVDNGSYFDSLVHVTADGKWLGSERYNASSKRLLNEMKKAGVKRACLVAIAEHVTNDTVANLTTVYPDIFVPIGSVNPSAMRATKAVEEAVRDLKERNFAGLKLHPRLNKYDPLDERSLAAIKCAGELNLPVFLCTFFRQPERPTKNTAEIVDQIVHCCPRTKIILLHGGGSSMLELFELVRMHQNLILDLSFTLNRYAGSSLDWDMQFLFERLDQRVTVGSDFPEYTPKETGKRLVKLMRNIPREKQENVLFRNLTALFKEWTWRKMGEGNTLHSRRATNLLKSND